MILKKMLKPEIDVRVISKDDDGNVLDDVVYCNAASDTWRNNLLRFFVGDTSGGGIGSVRITHIVVGTGDQATDTDDINAFGRNLNTVRYSKVTGTKTHVGGGEASIETDIAVDDAKFQWKKLGLLAGTKLVAVVDDTQPLDKGATAATIIWRVKIGTIQNPPSTSLFEQGGSTSDTNGAVTTQWLTNAISLIAGVVPDNATNRGYVVATKVAVGNGTSTPANTETTDSAVGTSAANRLIADLTRVSLSSTDPPFYQVYGEFPVPISFGWRSFALLAGTRLIVRIVDTDSSTSDAGSGVAAGKVARLYFNISMRPLAQKATG